MLRVHSSWQSVHVRQFGLRQPTLRHSASRRRHQLEPRDYVESASGGLFCKRGRLTPSAPPADKGRGGRAAGHAPPLSQPTPTLKEEEEEEEM
ncbi:hypothetical protein Pmani_026999 [Petrolisthes manimaculis]|uniref:Uncharacterized protein n=1 Tax=Petrolisthes manimaculis TaxID=1843537 RepID=A0AAE1P332_9EUCA|nr:hypothetical protein Pmani_026999 [Petrolisthes manimaculis]